MILTWDKPPKTMTTEDWKGISADGAPPGVYVPNMDSSWREKWKAKFVGGKDPRVEIRKTFEGVEKGKGYEGRDLHHHAQVLIVVRTAGMIVSTNGKIAMSFKDMTSLHKAVIEAKAVLDKDGEE